MRSSELPDLITRIIERKCGGIVSHMAVWKNAAAKLLGTEVSDENAARMVELMRSPRNLDALVAGLAQEGRSMDAFWDSLLPAVDNSVFGLEAWIAAIERVQDSLVEQGRAASPSSIVGYVQCTAEFASQGENGGALPELIQAMLEEYGFDGEEGCHVDPVE